MDEDIAKPEVYQFRIALREISPSIWRRVVKNIATGFIESTVNQVVSKRFLKHQSMQWTERCTHLLLQARTKTLNDELRHTFENWYPGMKATAQPPVCLTLYEGVLETAEAQHLIDNIETKMLKLREEENN